MYKKNSILIIDDEEDFIELTTEILKQSDYEIEKVTDGNSGLKKIRSTNYDLIMLDLIMPEINGFEILKEIKEFDSGLPVIILSGDDREEVLDKALKSGAYDFLKKPLEWSRLEVAVKNALITRKLTKEVNNLKEQLGEQYKMANFVGNSSKMQAILRNLNKVVNSDVTVCICGETGTGKELLAKIIHFNSHRRNQPFISVNCSTIPDSFLDEELFGVTNEELHIRKYGKFEQAHGGTLYLDDIAELTPVAQVKILNALQENKIVPFGAKKPEEIDLRVIAGTTKDLDQEVKKGKIREDLYFLLHVFPIFLPPLRERKEDIPILISNFIKKYNYKNNTRIRRISDEAMEYMINYNWMGNVRELENVLELSMLLVEGDTIYPEHLPISIISYGDSTINGGTYLDLKKAVALSNKVIPLEEIEEEVLKQALKLNNYNMSSTAHKLGIGRTTLYRKLQKYHIKVER